MKTLFLFIDDDKHNLIDMNYKDYCHHSYPDNIKMKYNQELDAIVSQNNLIHTLGFEACNYDLAFISNPKVKRLNTTLSVPIEKYQEILNINPHMKFFIFTSTQNRFDEETRQDHDKKINFLASKIAIESIIHLLNIEDYPYFNSSIDHSLSYTNNINISYYFKKGDVAFIERLNENERSKLRFIFKRLTEQYHGIDIFNQHSPYEFVNSSIIGPDSLQPKTNVGFCDKDCSNCYPLLDAYELCCMCFQYGSGGFSMDNKKAYMADIEKIKGMLNL